MSSFIAIPRRRQAVGHGPAGESDPSASPSSSSESSSPPSFKGSPRTPTLPSKGKQRAVEGTSPISSSSLPREFLSLRRPSLLGSSLSKSEYTVINLSHANAPPRLVSCVKSSQGFDWNPELFLPSYADHDSHDLEHRPDIVEDIILTDEEAAALMPQ